MKTKPRKSAASSQPGKLTRRSEADIRTYAKSAAAKETSKRLGARGAEPSAEDLKDIPVLTAEELRRMYRPVKAPVTVRLDGDILAWLKSKGGQYQTHMNGTLRDAMLSELKRGAMKGAHIVPDATMRPLKKGINKAESQYPQVAADLRRELQTNLRDMNLFHDSVVSNITAEVKSSVEREKGNRPAAPSKVAKP